MKRDSAAACCGDGCEGVDGGGPLPLHHVRHRGAFLRLCTSCVLRYHPGSFCASCFAVLASPENPVVHCSRCPTLSHIACLPDPHADAYLCPVCSNPDGFSYFPAPKDGILMDLSSARVLLAASRLAARTMHRAAEVARVDMERKVKEAAVARKRAIVLLEKEAGPPIEAMEPRKKVQRMNGMADVGTPRVVSLQARPGRFQEPIQIGRLLGIRGVVGSDGNKSPFVTRVQGHGKDTAVKGIPLSSQSSGFKDGGSGIVQSSQDVSVLRSNNRAIFTGSQTTTSLHS